MIDFLPRDWRDAVLLGRLQTADGPTPIVVSHGRVRDISRAAPTTSQFLNAWTGQIPPGQEIGAVEDFDVSTAWSGSANVLLAPVDLQCVKACGVTFAVSAV